MTLLELQRRMAADVCRPLTADFKMQEHEVDGSSIEELASSYVKPNALLSSFERLEIYNRQYWLRAIGAVSEDFPALQALLGDRRFDALVLRYLETRPSRSWTLRDWSADLPAFVAGHPSLAGRRHRLAADVARLEWAYVEAFDQARHEALGPEDLAQIGPESRLALQPHVRLLELSYPVDELVLAVRQGRPKTEVVSNAAQRRSSGAGKTLPTMKPRAVYLAVHRYEDVVYYRRIDREAYRLLSAIRDGAPLGEALATAFMGSRMAAPAQAGLIQACFAHAASLGWLCPRARDGEVF